MGNRIGGRCLVKSYWVLRVRDVTPRKTGYIFNTWLRLQRRKDLNYETWVLFRFKVKVKLLSHVQVFATPWTVAYQAPPSMGFSRQEYWSGLPFSIVVCKCNKEEEIYLQHCNFTSSVYKINPSVYTYIYISCKIQNIVYITHIANTRHQKRKDKVKRDWSLVITIYILIMKKQEYNCLKVT